mmetsp:Transcript_15848/g.52008  ORF Transcript_15848/g.52008 Transcript_15848/m.52008 type:complete len:508 (-) Transcript_15848:732-2255(-)
MFFNLAISALSSFPLSFAAAAVIAAVAAAISAAASADAAVVFFDSSMSTSSACLNSLRSLFTSLSSRFNSFCIAKRSSSSLPTSAFAPSVSARALFPSISARLVSTSPTSFWCRSSLACLLCTRFVSTSQTSAEFAISAACVFAKRFTSASKAATTPGRSLRAARWEVSRATLSCVCARSSSPRSRPVSSRSLVKDSCALRSSFSEFASRQPEDETPLAPPSSELTCPAPADFRAASSAFSRVSRSSAALRVTRSNCVVTNSSSFVRSSWVRETSRPARCKSPETRRSSPSTSRRRSRSPRTSSSSDRILFSHASNVGSRSATRRSLAANALFASASAAPCSAPSVAISLACVSSARLSAALVASSSPNTDSPRPRSSFTASNMALHFSESAVNLLTSAADAAWRCRSDVISKNIASCSSFDLRVAARSSSTKSSAVPNSAILILASLNSSTRFGSVTIFSTIFVTTGGVDGNDNDPTLGGDSNPAICSVSNASMRGIARTGDFIIR